MSNGTRIETDSFGPIDVPADAYWGAQTQRSIENFPFGSRERMPIEIVRALALVKQAAARVNRKHGLDAKLADAIEAAAIEVTDGKHDDQFPLVIWQTGSGTQSNMNVNEVIAGRANEMLTGVRGGKSPVHPNDHVNMSQSSNDSFPTALHIAATQAMTGRLMPALDRLMAALLSKAEAWGDIIKIGRTHLQDATPVTLGQEFSGYYAQLKLCKTRTEPMVQHAITRLAQGGTAVGTGLNAPQGFDVDFADQLSAITGTEFHTAPNKFEALASNDVLVDLSGRLNTLAVALTKIANDIRLLGSGPRSGLGELNLPENEPGSSIMPGKVNPVMCESFMQVAARVIGNDSTMTVCGAAGGQFQLNIMMPVMGHTALESVTLLASSCEAFVDLCVADMEANAAACEASVEKSLSMVTSLNPHIGYERAAQLAKEAFKSGKTIRQLCEEQGVLPHDTLAKALDPMRMTEPHAS